MAAQILRVRVALEDEAAVHDAHLGIAELYGGVLGRPKKVGAREGAHGVRL